MSFENISIIAQLNIELTPLWIALFVGVGALMIAILMVIIGAIAESQSKSNKAVSDSHSQEKFLNESDTDSESSGKSSRITPESISKKMFQPTRYREGYDFDSVDDFLDKAASELKRLIEENDLLSQHIADPENVALLQSSKIILTPEDIVNERFKPTKFKEGYGQDEVDDYLDEIVVEVRRLISVNDSLRKDIQV